MCCGSLLLRVLSRLQKKKKAHQPILVVSSSPAPISLGCHRPPPRLLLRTDPLDEHEASDDEDRVPIELGQVSVPGEPLAVVENPDQGEDDGEEAEQQRGREERQKELEALHLPPHHDVTVGDPNKFESGAETGAGRLGVSRPPPPSSPGGKERGVRESADSPPSWTCLENHEKGEVQSAGRDVQDPVRCFFRRLLFSSDPK